MEEEGALKRPKKPQPERQLEKNGTINRDDIMDSKSVVVVGITSEGKSERGAS